MFVSLLLNLDRFIAVRLILVVVACLRRWAHKDDGSPKYGRGVYHTLYHYTPLRDVFRYCMQIGYCRHCGILMSIRMSALILPDNVSVETREDPAQAIIDILDDKVLDCVDYNLSTYHVYALLLPGLRLRGRYQNLLRARMPRNTRSEWALSWPLYERAIVQTVEDRAAGIDRATVQHRLRYKAASAGVFSSL